MNVIKNNNNIQIQELGFNLELKADLLLNSLISQKTRDVLEIVLKERLEYLLIQFKHLVQQSEKDDKYKQYLKENRHDFIYEYACLNRDLFSLVDIFETFFDDNYDVMTEIYNIYKYNKIYE